MKMMAIVLAAGQGKRMKSDVAKQYLLMRGKPVLYYSLKAFEGSEEIDSIVVVVGEGEQEYVRNEIVDKYGFEKIESIVVGGKERYISVYQGLMAIRGCDYVFIHDGARPFVDGAIIERAAGEVLEHGAVVVGMPVKDTIKIADEEGFIRETPNRARVWAVQTPQVFEFGLIKGAYETLMAKEKELRKEGIPVTDDAMVIETYTGVRVKLVEGAYENIKITTPEDLMVGEAIGFPIGNEG